MAAKRTPFLIGLFVICANVLALQILQTRILSVVTHYHLAFFAISMAMLGMTAGALWVHFHPGSFDIRHLWVQLTRAAVGFAIATAASILLLVTSVVVVHPLNLVLTGLLWLKLLAILAPPYVFAGIVVSLALTRSPWPVGLVYAVDLAGAASGCLLVLLLLEWLDALSAVLVSAAAGAVAAALFRAARLGEVAGARGWLEATPPVPLAGALLAAALLNAWLHPQALVPTIVRRHVEYLGPHDVVVWNSFSRILAQGGEVRPEPAVMWAASAAMPDRRIEQRWVNIDGEAATVMYRFEGRAEELDFLRYDLVNFAYAIRNSGRAAVIGVGGGRDLLSAWIHGFRDITGVEMNPVFVQLLQERFRSFNRVVDFLGFGVGTPERHILLAAHDRIATLILAREPLAPFDLAALHARAAELGFRVLVAPDAPRASPMLARIMGALDLEALHELT